MEQLTLLMVSKMFLNDSIYNHQPKVGDVLLISKLFNAHSIPFSI